MNVSSVPQTNYGTFQETVNWKCGNQTVAELPSPGKCWEKQNDWQWDSAALTNSGSEEKDLGFLKNGIPAI